MEAYFRSQFPQATRRYGAPFLPGGLPNLDAMAFALGESPARLVYFASEGRFHYWERQLRAYRPVEPEERLLAFQRAIIRRSLSGVSADEARAVWILWNERQLQRVLEVARAILSVEETFFSGETGAARYIDGRIVQPVAAPSYTLFAEQAVEPRPGAILTMSEAYKGYWIFCRPQRLTPLRRAKFKERFTNETLTRWGVGIRHDLITHHEGDTKPKTCQGWQGLGLRTGAGLN